MWHRPLCCPEIWNATELSNEGTDDIPKSIAESVSGTLQFAEGNFIGLAEAMPEDKYSYIPTLGKFEASAASGNK